MAELRKDPVCDRWVIIAPERAERPSEPGRPPPAPPSGACPFCPGNERYTPHELLAYRSGDGPDGPGWQLRVFPNRYPALRVEGAIEREGMGLFDRMTGVGAHEVVVETPDHRRALGDLPSEEIARVLFAWRERLLDLRRDGRLSSAIVFKNQGYGAGSTLGHAHSQLIALPRLPRELADELSGARRHYEQRERCLFCDILRQEGAAGERLIVQNGGCLSIAPFAPRVPFECWLLPARHHSSFEETPDGDLAEVADALRETLRRVDAALARPALNLVLHTAPLNPPAERNLPYWHWHLEVLPVTVRPGGFEWGSGFFINPTPPEEAAEFLRKVQI